jgi:hypothetical protein
MELQLMENVGLEQQQMRRFGESEERSYRGIQEQESARE